MKKVEENGEGEIREETGWEGWGGGVVFDADGETWIKNVVSCFDFWLSWVEPWVVEV